MICSITLPNRVTRVQIQKTPFDLGYKSVNIISGFILRKPVKVDGALFRILLPLIHRKQKTGNCPFTKRGYNNPNPRNILHPYEALPPLM
jgi:hypothetical protein